MPREDPKSWPPTIYKYPQRIQPLGSTMCLPHGDRMCWSGWLDTASASGRYAPSPRMSATCPRSNTTRWSSTVVKLVSAQSKPWPNVPEEMTGRGQPRVRSSPVRVYYAKIVTGRIWSHVTWCAQRPVWPSPPVRNQSTLIGRWHQHPVTAWPASGQYFLARNTTATSPPSQPLLKCANHQV
jgi:hypothetical protein